MDVENKNYFEITHVVTFEETNLVGNVYYANHVRWQGYCREMFLREKAPEVLQMLREGLYLVTVKVSCEYLQELFAFDEVLLRMRVDNLTQNGVTMMFDYFKTEDGEAVLVATGKQKIASFRKRDEILSPVQLPQQLRNTLKRYEL